MSHRCSIFISYRRSDAPGYVRALMSDLRNTFGSNQVFLDMETIEAGNDFVDAIEQAVGGCEIMLAIIGPTWLSVSDQLGQRRIYDPDDFIRLEIYSALKRNIPIIPVLVDQAVMPKAEDLPLQLQAFASLQAVSLSHGRWVDDMRGLIGAIENLTVEPRLAMQYDAAKLKLKQGYWEGALNEFNALEAVRPGYGNIREITRPLHQLAQQLLASGPESHRWQRVALKHPIALLLVISFIPHMLAALFNYIFNWHVIVHPMQIRGIELAETVFSLFAVSVNTVFFFLGIVIFVHLVKPITKGLKGLEDGLSLPIYALADLRKRCLYLGRFIALIGLGMWIVVGPIYPILIGALEIRDYVLFVISLTISGLAVSTYPFFMVTWLCTHVLYRPFVVPGSVDDMDIRLLDRVSLWKWTYLLLAGGLPMLVISLGFILGSLHSLSQPVNVLLGIVGLGGMVGFLMALLLFKSIQKDLELMRQLLWACGDKQIN